MHELRFSSCVPQERLVISIRLPTKCWKLWGRRVHVPELGQKIQLLIRKGLARNQAELAEHLGISRATLNNYINGTLKSSADWVPDKRMPALARLFALALARPLLIEDVEKLIAGPLADLEDAFRTSAVPSIEEILRREARQDTGRLYRPRGMSLVEYDRADDDKIPHVRLDERFGIEFRAGRGGYGLVVQNAQQVWGAVRLADGAISPRLEPGSILVPGVAQKQITYMRETSSVGPHRFILFVSPAPCPRRIVDAASAQKSLDWPMLEELAGHFDSQPKHLREVHLLRLSVVRN